MSLIALIIITVSGRFIDLGGVHAVYGCLVHLSMLSAMSVRHARLSLWIERVRVPMRSGANPLTPTVDDHILRCCS